MKLFSLILAITLLFAVTAAAADISFGLKAGLALSNQDFEYQTDLGNDFDNRLGFQGGAFTEIALSPNLSLQADVQYIPAGFKIKFEETTPDSPEGTGKILTVKPRIDYISIPLLVKAGLPSGEIKPYLLAGPRVNIKVGANQSLMAPLYDYIKDVSFGLTVGAGTEVRVSPKVALMFEFTYNPDFTNIFKADEFASIFLRPTPTLESIKNRTISIQVGMRFGNVLPD